MVCPTAGLPERSLLSSDTKVEGTEILTHILSHLHPDSHGAVALVSKRFYSLVTTPHAWRMAFQRSFPGQDALSATGGSAGGVLEEDDAEFIRSEIRQFARLNAHASWRSEYLLRTRLLRSLARGKPGAGDSARIAQSGKKVGAVLTYNSKLPSMVTNVHATFTSTAKKPPRVLHAAADVCVGSASDPTNGRVEKWGLDDPFAFAQLNEVVPQVLPHGIGEGPAAVPNVMDVSQPYGMVGGEGFPGGRVFYRPTGEFRGKYLGQEPNVVEAHPDIPKIPELSEGICSVWVAKSSLVPSLTQAMVGIMVGSTLGVVTTYALGHDPSGPRYNSGEITARWVLSPGVPIIALKVDDNYTQKRKAAGRAFAVALNALGEVYYLTMPPDPLSAKSKADDSTKCAWHAGRSTYWQLVEATRRQARLDDTGRNALRGAYSPHSPCLAMNLAKEQMVAEAREIERFLRYKPAHFRKACHGWDMRRRLEVDFASSGGDGAGEGIFVIDCALEEGNTAAITRYTRYSSRSPLVAAVSVATPPAPAPEEAAPSLFGSGQPKVPSPHVPGPSVYPPVTSSSNPIAPTSTQRMLLQEGLDEWRLTTFRLNGHAHSQVTTSSIDSSLFALMTPAEDPLRNGARNGSTTPATPSGQASIDLPGRGARMIALGTNTGAVLLWNMRGEHVSDGVQPVRVIQTESPEVTSLAMSALYLVHGGSDGLVQAWDPLASTMEPIRTINARTPGRAPRPMANANPALHHSAFSAVGAIYLDPDPAVLRGIVAFGTFIRYWAYSSSGQPSGRRRRMRHADVHGRPGTRRHGGGVKGYIAAETEELRIEQQVKAREQAWLRSRFGVGLGDLTEEEALRYAEMVSQESFADEQRRTSASDTGSAADLDATSTTGSFDTITPDPSVIGRSPSAPVPSSSRVNEAVGGSESDYELQIQQAIRLSLLEAGSDMGQSPREHSSGDYETPLECQEKQRGVPSLGGSPAATRTPLGTTSYGAQAPSSVVYDTHAEEDDDLQLALRLSLAEEESRRAGNASSSFGSDDEFPALGGGHGKGKGKAH